MNKIRFIFLVPGLIGTAGVILSVIMLISAIQFNEMGRMVLYLVTTIVCTELAVLSFIKAFSRKEK